MSEISLLSVDRTLAERLLAALDGRVPVTLIQSVETREGAGAATASIVVIDASSIPPDRSIGAAVAAAVEAGGGQPVVLATEGRDADIVLAAMRAGASDVIDRAIDGPEAGQVLARLLNAFAANQNSRGQLTLVLGPDADTPAIFAADLAIARSHGRPGHLLIDCTMPTSAAEAYLDLRVDYGIASAISDIERLDNILLSSALARHEPSNLLLLTLDGGMGSEPAGITPADIGALLKLLRATCDDVVLCAGSLRHGKLLRDLAASADNIEFVCGQSIRELDASRRLLEKLGFDAVTLRRTRLIVWNHDVEILLDGRRMITALGLGSFVNLPVDHVALANALNSGRPLALTGGQSDYVQALHRVGGLKPPSRIDAGFGLDRLRQAVARLVERA